MAVRKSSNLLPGVFQTKTNKKFLSATLDQLISEPNLEKINGYVGRKFAPTYKNSDNYVIEPDAQRQHYQLEPSVVVRNEFDEIVFFSTYVDFLNKIQYYGGLINNHDRLFENEFYTYDPGISYDKLINFSQYYWLPNGPDPVLVTSSGAFAEGEIIVKRNASLSRYDFEIGGVIYNNLNFLRGGTYKFIVDQPGYPFWIQVEPGTDGKLNATPTISSRDVFGITNNGVDVGEITLNVPFRDSQRFVAMNTVASIEYAAPLRYKDLHNSLLSTFQENFPQYIGITQQLNGKRFIFVDQDRFTSQGDEIWQAPPPLDKDGNIIPGFDYGDFVPFSQRYSIWKAVYVNSGIIGDPLVRLEPDLSIEIDEKVFIKFGLVNANLEFFKDLDGFLKRVPLISCRLDTWYYQDQIDGRFYGEIKLIDPLDTSIDVENDILGKKFYISPNGVKFTSGLKISLGPDVIPEKYKNKTYYVENVGDSINLVDVNWLVRSDPYNEFYALNYPNGIGQNKSNAEYITIKRDSLDYNPWSRNNRWFHINVITDTAKYNGTTPIYDQNARATRPIVQFEGNFELFNFGRIGKQPIDILDTSTVDPFNTLEGKVLSSVFGIPIIDENGLPIYPEGLRVIFSASKDPLVKEKIYLLKLNQYEGDPVTGELIGDYFIQLQIAPDGQTEIYDTVIVKQGLYKGQQYWYDGEQWKLAQQKTELQQEPLFNFYDNSGKSLTTYKRSNFAGTKIFGYLRKASGNPDPVLGFPLSYRSFAIQGDIEFSNFYHSDTFSYLDGEISIDNVRLADIGYVPKIINRYNTKPANIWKTVIETSRQYQIISYIYNGTNNPYRLDIASKLAETVAYLKVYCNNKFLTAESYSYSNNLLTLSPAPQINDKVDVLIYSDEISKSGYYEIPSNLNLNAQNIDVVNVTLGQIRNHLIELGQNSEELKGVVLGPYDIRDYEYKSQGGTILQHSAPVPYGMLFLQDNYANLIESVKYAQKEYTKFKNKFLELSISLPGVDPENIPGTVDTIITSINANKNSQFPWFYSDMVPYGNLINVIEYPIFNPTIKTYELTNVFNDKKLSNTAVLVYLNQELLIKDIDYIFNQDRPAITFTSKIELAEEDLVKIVEYANTDGNYIPETPTKLGLYPKFIPQKYLDNTYRTPIYVIQGHDGSITPAFNDFRDDLILELEKRIFNNIKVEYDAAFDIYWQFNPSKFRDSHYNWQEFSQILSKNFLSWAGNNRVDFSSNKTFSPNDAFTWNLSRFADRLDGELLQGSWRACYQYFYDTTRPHIAPWEMLGFSIKPDWWEDEYGPAPYTGTNKLLWDDLEAGRIKSGPREGIDVRFARPGLSQVIPVDQNGFLTSPTGTVVASVDSKSAVLAWSVGNYGPAEWAWRTSSEFPFAMVQAMAVAKPAKFFGLLLDNSRYKFNTAVGQYLTVNSNNHITQLDVILNGDSTTGTLQRSGGYLNYIVDYLRNLGINPYQKIKELINRYEVNLSYRMAGFTDRKFVNVLAEQSSPSSTNDSVLVPDENYDIYLHKSSPINKLVYSAVIVEKTTNGYTVKGYDLNNPFFTIIPSTVNSNSYRIRVLQRDGVVFRDFQNKKLLVPYGYEFTTIQQIVDFLISYERFLIAQGFIFADREPNLQETKNWKLSVKEFLFWAQQGWKPGSILVLSPVSNVLNLRTKQSIVDSLQNTQFGSRIIDQNFRIIRNNNYEVYRTSTDFQIEIEDQDAMIGLVELDLVQYEHVLILDNTTVFNDVIYRPELGNRQFRLKVVGQKTGEWDGSLYAPGFVFNSEEVSPWQRKDYLKGELVEYKNQFYVALENIAAAEDFQFSQWKPIDKNSIKTGLLDNFSTIAKKSQNYYDSYGELQDEEQLEFGHSLIGFRNRQFLDDLGLNTQTQIEFYKGYIKQKGTVNAVEQLTKSTFNNISSEIIFDEEWAVRIGEYGALDVNPYIEIELDENLFSVNPAAAKFVGDATANQGNGLTVFNKDQLFKKTEKFVGHIAIDRAADSNYDNDIPTAGYVNINDVNTTLFDIENYTDLNDKLDEIGSGYLIWVARDFAKQWNVYRVCETNNHVLSVSNSLDNFITVTTDHPHNLLENNIFIIKGFDSDFDGFYQVTNVVDIRTVVVRYFGNQEVYDNLTTLESFGMLLKLDSMRFLYMEDSRVYGLNNPLHQWKKGDKIWIDVDAPTSLIQGQPVETPNRTWKVYEKELPWTLSNRLEKLPEDISADTGYGTSVKMSPDTLTLVSGSPFGNTYPRWNVGAPVTTGKVSTYNKDIDNNFIIGTDISPDDIGKGNVAIAEFGHSLDFAENILVVGAPGTAGNIGYTFIFERLPGTSLWEREQVIVGNVNAAGRFGHSVAFDEFGNWLYIGAPGEEKVYIYGLQKNVPVERQVTSISDDLFITLSGNLISNTFATISQPDTGAVATIISGSFPLNVNTHSVSSLSNFLTTGQNFDSLGVDKGPFGNIQLNNAVSLSAGVYLTQTTTSANLLVWKDVDASDRVYGFYQNASVFDTVGLIEINGILTANVIPTFVGSGNIFYNGVDTGLTISSVANNTVASNIQLEFTPFVPNTASSLTITTVDRTFIPDLEYYISSNVVYFTDAVTGSPVLLEEGTYIIEQKPFYRWVETVQGQAGSEFGYVVDSSLDGAQLGIGAPNDIVNVAVKTDGSIISVPINQVTANVVSYTEYPAAGAVYMYDRVIEAFKSDGERLYETSIDTIGSQDAVWPVYRVTIEDVEVPYNEYTIVANTSGIFNTIRFNEPPEIGRIIYVETNRFNLLEKIIGIDSLEGGLSAIQKDCRFGTSLTICSDNCAIYIGAPNYDAGTLYNTGAVWKFHNKGRLYGINRGFADNPVFTQGDSIRLDNFEVTVGPLRTDPVTGNPMSSLDSFIEDINDAQILGVYAYNENNRLVVQSDRTVAKNLLRILSGKNVTGGAGDGSRVLIASGMAVFAFMQIIVTNFKNKDEHFGNKVILARNAYLLVIASDRGTTHIPTTFDAETTIFDDTSTKIIDQFKDGGSVYIYELYDDPRDMVEHPGRYSFAQQLNPTNLELGDAFGASIDIVGGYVLVGAPKDDEVTLLDLDGNVTVSVGDVITQPTVSTSQYIVTTSAEDTNFLRVKPFGNAAIVTSDVVSSSYIYINGEATQVRVVDVVENTGSVYIFENPTLKRGWNLIRHEQPKVDIDSVNRMYLYDKNTNTILTNIEFIDPAKGKILGSAEQEITYKTEFDPAFYNRGTGEHGNISEQLFWNDNQVSEVWWNLSKVRFIDYEQDSLTYRTLNWGALFPGSIIEVCEWVKSPVLPSQYVENGGSGIPKYADDSAYVEITFVDPITGIITSNYYYWVVDKTTVEISKPSRKLPVKSIAQLISNPKSQNIAYAAVTRNDNIILYNIASYLADRNTVLHIDYELIRNDSIIHSEYDLIRTTSPDDKIPAKIVNKLIDSLCGIDFRGSTVPDPLLSPADKYGIGIRPRQGLFIDRLKALSDAIDYVNRVLKEKPVVRQYDLGSLLANEPEPSLSLGEYDLKVSTQIELDYIDTNDLQPGYKVLAERNTEQDNLWSLYELQSDKLWQLIRIQAFKTDLYWNYIDWYAPGFGPEEQIEYVVDTLVDALRLPVKTGDEVLVKINNSIVSKFSGWNLLTVTESGDYQVVGIQNGTIQIDDTLSNFDVNQIGLDNQPFDNTRFDENPNLEIRNIFLALRDNIFINELSGQFTQLFFVLVNYLLSEQKYVDWIFKTSFISVTHKLRSLSQFPNYVKDNQTYYLDYINEVKPYSTKVREYIIEYNGNDEVVSDLTDFDLPPYYDVEIDQFRSPSGEIPAKDQQLWANGILNDELVNRQYPVWYTNRELEVAEIKIIDAGLGYGTPPEITILGGGANVIVATAKAILDTNTGAISSITVTSGGSGYTLTPAVVINGSSQVPAKAYAVLRNPKVRSFDTAIKFDRVTYNSKIVDWNAYTGYTQTTFSNIGGILTWTGGDIVSYSLPEDGKMIRKAYSVNSNLTPAAKFVASNFIPVASNVFTTAGDRILGFHQPGIDEPIVDTINVDLIAIGNTIPGSDALLGNNAIIVHTTNFIKPGMYIHGGNVTNARISEVYYDYLLLSDPITASKGDFILQTNSGAKVKVLETVDNSKLIKISDYFTTAGFTLGFGNINIVDGFTSNVTITSVYPIDDTINYIILDKDQNIVEGTKFVASYKNFGQLLKGVEYPGVTVLGKKFGQNPGFGGILDIDPFDANQPAEGGGALFDQTAYDSLISSTYTDSGLGVRPEDIIVDGSDYINTYTSHAPEELLPGLVLDTLDLKVYTEIGTEAGNVVVGYRMFSRGFQQYSNASSTSSVVETTFLRISDNYSTKLRTPLHLTDTVINVVDVTKIPIPNPSGPVPGVIFINSERITYYSIDFANNAVGQIRRGTKGTGAATIHAAGSLVIDGSLQQTIPGTTYANVQFYGNIAANANLATSTATIWFNPGDNIISCTDGTGLEGSTTDAAIFLKENPASEIVVGGIADILTTEDAVNTITTEDDDNIIEEGF